MLFLIGLTTALITLVEYSASASVGQISYTNAARLLFDSDGNQVDAYGSPVNNFNGKYYLYGNSFAIDGVPYGIKSYSSVDLVNWAYEGFLFDPAGQNPCSGNGGCGRPHIVYNEKSQQYVLWTNAGSVGYSVATSTSPSTGFTFLNATAAIDPRLDSLIPADFTVEVFDGKGYIVHSALDFGGQGAGSLWPPLTQTIHISELTDDLLNTTQVSYNVTSPAFDLVDQETESPDLFIRNGICYVAASNTCGFCNGSIGLLYRSNSIQGPWNRQIIAGDSCGGQVEGVLPLTDPQTGEVTYVWHSTSVPGGPLTGFGGHIFQPLVFNPDGSVQDLDCSPTANFGPIQFTIGNGTAASGNITATTDGSPAIADYHYVCDSTQFFLYQTWTSSKSGTLTSVAVNLAASVQNVGMTLTVFKFSTVEDLISPGYKYTTLATATYVPANLTYVLDTAVLTSFTNATVSAGDNLGLSLVPANADISTYGKEFVDYCHLEYDTALYPGGVHGDDGNGPGVLLQQGAGQNSLRGINGKTSPVYERAGRAVKFFATVE